MTMTNEKRYHQALATIFNNEARDGWSRRIAYLALTGGDLSEIIHRKPDSSKKKLKPMIGEYEDSIEPKGKLKPAEDEYKGGTEDLPKFRGYSLAGPIPILPPYKKPEPEKQPDLEPVDTARKAADEWYSNVAPINRARVHELTKLIQEAIDVDKDWLRRRNSHLVGVIERQKDDNIDKCNALNNLNNKIADLEISNKELYAKAEADMATINKLKDEQPWSSNLLNDMIDRRKEELEDEIKDLNSKIMDLEIDAKQLHTQIDADRNHMKEAAARIEVLNDIINRRREDLMKVRKSEDIVLQERNRLLEAIPECLEHGKHCVPHAVSWIKNELVGQHGPISPDDLLPTEDRPQDFVMTAGDSKPKDRKHPNPERVDRDLFTHNRLCDVENRMADLEEAVGIKHGPPTISGIEDRPRCRPEVPTTEDRPRSTMAKETRSDKEEPLER